jgi:hypothetical protein
MLFRETVAVYCENQMKHINTVCGQNVRVLNVTAGGTYAYNYQSTLEDKINNPCSRNMFWPGLAYDCRTLSLQKSFLFLNTDARLQNN